MGRSDIMILQHGVKNRTLYEAFFRDRDTYLDIFMLFFGVAFLGLMANIRIPIWPVPITMQTFGIFLIAFFFGSRKGFLAILSYIFVGLLGFGVFAGYKSGIGAIIGPTSGYIIGFLFMAFFVGKMIEEGYGRTKKSVLLCMIVGEIILYSFGLSGLWIYLGNVSFLKVLQLGLLPFIIGDIIKISMAVGLFPYLWRGSEKLLNNY